VEAHQNGSARFEAPLVRHAISALYGAFKANSPRVVTAGQQDTRMRLAHMVDESITASLECARPFDYRGQGDYFSGRRGEMGQGLSGTRGVKVGMPDRTVVAISGDGSATGSI
jgi:thiamine pyrophosphate-dependent acetolactate synthase large subunit-like protein